MIFETFHHNDASNHQSRMGRCGCDCRGGQSLTTFDKDVIDSNWQFSFPPGAWNEILL